MLRRIITLLILALIPSGLAYALPDGSAQTPPYTVTSSLLDQYVKTTATATVNKAQGFLGYNLGFHDAKNQYLLPVCADPSYIEVDGRNLDPISFTAGDTITVSVRTSATAAAKPCIGRVVREKLSTGASGGECLQHFQVRHEITGEPDKLVPKTEYAYILTAYARPTLDCDGKTYGASPITTVVAAGKPFIVTLERGTGDNKKEINRWSLTTNNAGQAGFTYTFNVPSDGYHFSVKPGATAVAGDVIGWDETVADPNPTPSPTPAVAAKSAGRLTALPIIVILVIVLGVAGGAEYWRWIKRHRSFESPEQEYDRVKNSKIL